MNLFKVNFFLFLITASSIVGCGLNKKISNETNKTEFLHQLLFNSKETRNFLEYLNDKNPIYVDSMFEFRPMLKSTVRNRFMFVDSMNNSLLKEGKKYNKIPIIIPDSLKNKFEYRKETYENLFLRPPCTIISYSPLLPTKKKHIFLLQEYTLFCYIEDDRYIAIPYRFWHVYKIKNRKITFIKTIHDENNDESPSAGSIPEGVIIQK